MLFKIVLKETLKNNLNIKLGASLKKLFNTIQCYATSSMNQIKRGNIM